MVFTLSFNIAVSRVILQHWQWQSVDMGLSRPTWLDCQSAWLHFRSVLTAKDLKFRFHTSALPLLPKTWCSASAFPLCLDCQRSEVPRPHFRSALTAENVKFCFRTSALPLLPNMWSSAPALPLCLDWQRSEVPLSTLVLPGLTKMWSSASAFHLCLDFQRFAVSLLHFRSVLTAKDLKIGFSTNTLPSLPNRKFRLHTSLLHWLQKICSFTFQICFHSQRCERTSALPWLPKFCLLSSAVGSYFVFPHNFVLSYMKD